MFAAVTGAASTFRMTLAHLFQEHCCCVCCFACAMQSLCLCHLGYLDAAQVHVKVARRTLIKNAVQDSGIWTSMAQ